MISSLRAATPQSGVSSNPNYIFLLDEIKLLVPGLIEKTGIAKRFKPRLYNYVDFILPVLYTLSTTLSLEQACEELNNLFTERVEQTYGVKPKVFSDGVRKRRFIPHQTKVDQFLRRFTEKEVQFVFGNLITTINERIRRLEINSSKVKFIADNTKYPYYGNCRTDTEIKHPKLPGTKVCRMFQGHSVYGCKLHLFTQFNIIRKDIYRAKEIPASVSWLKFSGYKISYSLVDREFYRVTLIRELRKLLIPVIMPSKKYPKVIHEMVNFIRFKRKLVDIYLFTQNNNQYPKQKSINVYLPLIGHNNQTAEEIREKYYSTKLKMDEIVKEMAGFFTTLAPWKNVRAYIRFLVRTYKQRWNIETAFRCLNSTHYSFRNRESVKSLAQIYMKALIYNNWQFWRKHMLKECKSYSAGTQQLFLKRLSDVIVEYYEDILYERVRKVLKQNKEV